jgi:DNA-binding NarL/FixJ family response regulator
MGNTAMARARLVESLALGAALSTEDAISLALTDDEPAATAGTLHGEPDRSRLSPRERQVSQLIAQGLTNREISRALSISEKTVGSHVDHIMTKLDLRSRTRIAVWASQHGLGPSQSDRPGSIGINPDAPGRTRLRNHPDVSSLEAP